MHIQVIDFNLVGIREVDYVELCNELADSFAAVPGLISKFWLKDTVNNCYGGIYFWESYEAMEKFTKSDLFHSVLTHPNLRNLSSMDFSLLEDPTNVTRGYLLNNQVDHMHSMSNVR